MESHCQNIQELMPESITGTLPAEKADALREHISSCPVCAEYLQALQADDKLLGNFVEAMQPAVARLEDSVIDALNREGSRKPVISISIWREIMKSPITKVAAAAVIIITAMVGLHQYTGSIDVASPAFAEMIQAMEKVAWVHKVTTKRIKNKGRYEEWVFYDYCDKPKLVFAKSDKGDFSCQDYLNCMETYYDPEADTKVIGYRPEYYDPWWRPTPQSLVERWKKRFEKGGTHVTHKMGEYEGIDADIYCSIGYDRTDQGDRYVSSEFKLIVDRNKHLPLATAFKFWVDGTLGTDRDKKYSYPVKGPNDIYELGCPKEAKVFDNSPTPELLEAFAGYRNGREASPLRYIAILVQGTYDTSSDSYLIDGADMCYCDGYLHRYHMRVFTSLTQKEFAAKAGDSFDSIMKWWTDEGKDKLDIRYETTYLYGQEYCCWLQRSGWDKDWKTLYKGYSAGKDRMGPRTLCRYTVYRDVLSNLGWTDWLLKTTGSWQISLVEDDYSRSNNVLCIEVLGNKSSFASKDTPPRGSLFYLNPERDYICQKYELYPRVNRDYFGEVVEYGQTDLGQWYPRKILTRWQGRDETARTPQKMTIVYLDTNPEFPPGIFNPDTLLK